MYCVGRIISRVYFIKPTSVITMNSNNMGTFFVAEDTKILAAGIFSKSTWGRCGVTVRRINRDTAPRTLNGIINVVDGSAVIHAVRDTLVSHPFKADSGYACLWIAGYGMGCNGGEQQDKADQQGNEAVLHMCEESR